MPSSPGSRPLAPSAVAWLDGLRALAAFAVFYGHSWLGWQGPSPGAPVPLYLQLTRFGRPAVMVFFALSGYLVGGGVLRRMRDRSWTWRGYIFQRTTRLYVVLLPALMLCLLWDRLGIAVTGTVSLYGGNFPGFLNWPVALRSNWHTLAGNALFLQSRFVLPFGSNVPLWSLAFEFWYYLAFPCAVAAFYAFRRERRLTQALIWSFAALALLYVGGRNVVFDAPAWLAGAGITLLPAPRRVWRASWAVPVGWGALVSACCLWAHVSQPWFADWEVALGCVVMLYAVIHSGSATTPRRLAGVARHFAHTSYTLYLVHLPFLVFLESLWIGPVPWPRDERHVLGWLLMFAAVWAYAEAVAWCFESRTDWFRGQLQRRPGRGRAAAAS